MKKIFSLLLLCCCSVLSMAGVINVSTATTSAGAYVPPPNADPFWKVNGLTSYVLASYAPYWQATPVAGTNAGWIAPNANLNNQPVALHTFERSFYIAPCTKNFTTDFGVAYDDSLVSLELISPGGVATPLPVATLSQPYYQLTAPIVYSINCPAAGTWKIRAKIRFLDNVGGYMLSGYIRFTDPNCCDTTCKLTVNVPQVNTAYNPCGSTFNLKCDNKYTFNRKLTCSPNGCVVTAVKGATLKDPSNNTPAWAASFIAALGGGSLAIPAGVAPGTYTLTYYYGVGNQICDSCKIYLNIACTDCNCVLTTNLKSGTLSYNPKCGDTSTFNCASTIGVTRSLNCNSQGSVHLNDVSLTDNFGNTPSWVTPFFLTNLASGNVTVPTGVSGVFALKYVWGQKCRPCDSCTYYIKIRCCTGLQVSAGPDINSCCPSQTFLNATVGGGVTPYTYLWTPAAGLSNPNIANPNCTAAGIYVITVTDARGCTGRDTVKVTFSPNTPSCCKMNQKVLADNKTSLTIANEIKLRLIPNPVAGNTLLVEYANKVSKAVSISITDMQGKRVINKQFAARSATNPVKYTLDVQTLPNGMYNMTLLSGDNTTSQKFVVAR